MNSQSLIANWNYPTKIRIGTGRLSELPKACNELRMISPLLVTDPGLTNSSMVENALSFVRNEGMRVEVFSQIKPNPTGTQIMDGVNTYNGGAHDGVIALGGGSAIDAAKTIALMVGQEHSLWDFEDVGDNWLRVNVDSMTPVVAIPTTAGTGSEVGRCSVITDTLQQVKKIIFHPRMLPSSVILDPELTVGLPKPITAATGMDALSHCLEAYCAPTYHPMAEAIALEGIRLIKENLLLAYQDGNNLVARTHMLVASTMGATAFQRGLGAMHALAHPLGALYDAHHGRLNAILMPYVLIANRVSIEEKIVRLAHYLSLSHGFDGFLKWVLQMRLELGIEHTLSEIGIDTRQLNRLASMATEDAASGSNPIVFTQEHYKDILYSALHGI